MSVASQFELDEPSALLDRATQRWSDWSREHPALRQVDPCGLRPWLRTAVPSDADDVLHALVTLAATDGGDDTDAARLTAWALLPGATTLAHRLRTLDPDIDHLVASQLWLEIRSFPHRRLRRVAANILMSTRCAVLATCGTPAQLERTDPTWSHTRAVDPTGPFWSIRAQEPCLDLDPVEELDDVLRWAHDQGVLSDDDRTLLQCLLQVAHEVPVERVGRGHGGLMANEISRVTAERCGVSVRTVRRRTLRSLTALAQACQHPNAGRLAASGFTSA